MPDHSPTATLPTRFPSLDGLRGVAILLVLVHQFTRIGGHDPLSRMVEVSFDLGWIGVQLFFCLSGFLITGILADLRGTPHAYRDFMIRRVLRIFPLYFGALALILGLLPMLGLVPASYREHSLWLWLYLSNWTQPHEPSQLPHFWSLAVEEQFYLIWPFAALSLAPRALLRLCVVVAMASLVLRVSAVLNGVDPEVTYMSSFARMDALAMGGAAALMLRLPGGLERAKSMRRRLLPWAAGIFLAGLLITRLYPRTSPLGQTVGYSLLAGAFSITVLALAVEDASCRAAAWCGWLRSTPMTRLGLYSYGMYVFHKPLHDLVGKPALARLGFPGDMALGAGVAYVTLGISVTLAVGALSYWACERHFLNLARRLAPRSPPPAPDQPKPLF